MIGLEHRDLEIGHLTRLLGVAIRLAHEIEGTLGVGGTADEELQVTEQE